MRVEPSTIVKRLLINQGMADLVDKYGVNTGKAVNMLGYIDSNDKITYFEGSIEGYIVQPRGDNGFGWDMIFQPSGYDKTFAEMSQSEKNAISMRRMAFEKLNDYQKS